MMRLPRPVLGRRARGFTLLEIMVAIAILGLGLTAIMSAQAGAFAAAAHARNLSQATGLARCKMMEVEEDTLRNGFQVSDAADEGPCCDGDETTNRMHCAWRVEVPVLPTPEYGQLDLASNIDTSSLGPLAALMQPGGAKALGSSGGISDLATQLFGQAGVPPGTDPSQIDPSQLSGSGTGTSSTGSAGLIDGLTDPSAPPPGAGGSPIDAISGIVMGMVYPDLKTYFEASTRRATIDVSWKEGAKVYTLTIEQWIVQPQQGIPDDDDPDSDDSITGKSTNHKDDAAKGDKGDGHGKGRDHGGPAHVAQPPPPPQRGRH